jgi:hypothetical protein
LTWAAARSSWVYYHWLSIYCGGCQSVNSLTAVATDVAGVNGHDATGLAKFKPEAAREADDVA